MGDMPGDEARGGRSWVLETPSATVPAAGSLIQNVRKFVCVCVCVCIYICVCVCVYIYRLSVVVHGYSPG